jgi:hypothetical protein
MTDGAFRIRNVSKYLSSWSILQLLSFRLTLIYVWCQNDVMPDVPLYIQISASYTESQSNPHCIVGQSRKCRRSMESWQAASPGNKLSWTRVRGRVRGQDKRAGGGCVCEGGEWGWETKGRRILAERKERRRDAGKANGRRAIEPIEFDQKSKEWPAQQCLRGRI